MMQMSRVSCLPVKGEEEEVHNPNMMEKQGIMSILGYESEKTTSLRRTLSADMSSKKWLSSPMKKIASSRQIAISLEEEEYSVAKSSQSNIWSSILSKKAGEDTLPPPYVVKRSTSSLSKKSLKICTESLGSETGDEEKEEEQQGKELEFIDNEELQVVKYTQYSTTKKEKATITRSFPPPLPTLARTDGPSLHMHSHRKDGRLLLEAVSLPSQNYFQAQRHDGRLLLTLINTHPLEEERVEHFVDVFDISEEQEQEQERDENIDNGEKDEVGIFFMEEEAPKVASGMHRSTVMMNKIVERENRINPTWPHHKSLLNLMKLEVVEEEELDPTNQHGLAQSLPLPFNTCQYFWRAKPTMASVIMNQQSQLPLKNSLTKMYEQKELVVMRGNKADCLVPALRGCKEPRRSLLIWEPHCIATT